MKPNKKSAKAPGLDRSVDRRQGGKLEAVPALFGVGGFKILGFRVLRAPRVYLGALGRVGWGLRLSGGT